MRKDISNSEDIELLVNAFYKQILKDEEIGFIFRDYMSQSLPDHLPTMYAFWESVLLHSGTYRGNPMLRHIELHQRVALTEAHFDRWISLWEATIDQYFIGTKAEEAKSKALNMKNLMLYKINQSNNPNFIQ